MLLSHWTQRIQLLIQQSRSLRRRTARRRNRPEMLEPRVLLTVATSFEAGNGELNISSDAGDQIVVDVSAGEVTVNGTTTGVLASDVQRLDVDGGPDANLINLTAVTAASFPNLVLVDIDGNDGDDVISGSQMADDIDGNGGDDRISGQGGNDTLSGSAGSDQLLGSSGSDSISGGDGDDEIRGQGGSGDIISGGMGDDSLDGGAGTDRLAETGDVDFDLNDDLLTGMGTDAVAGVERAALTGGASANMIDASQFSGMTTISAGSGNDTVMGTSSRDVINGLDGDDDIDAGDGDDFISGGSGRDRLNGSGGNDRIRGQGGSGDSLTGGDGDDSLDGGTGTDRIIETGDVDFTLSDDALIGNGNDSITGVERAEISGGASGNLLDASLFTGTATLLGSTGSDTIRGGSGRDVIRGGDDADDIDSGDGDDDVDGETGDDSLRGGAGGDRIRGGGGDDVLRGGDDDDDLDGNDGNDLIDGDAGDDAETGGLLVDVDATYRATLTTAGSVEVGEIKFEQSLQGDAEVELEVEIQDVADGTYDIVIDGVTIGQITVTGGEGKLKFSSRPDDLDELALPAGLPVIAAGTSASITGVASGSFIAEQHTELTVPLTPVSGNGSGTFEFEQKAVDTFELKVRVRHLAPGSYALSIGGVEVGTIVVEADGRGELELETEGGIGDFPPEFTGITADTTVTVGSVLTASIVLAPGA